MEFGLFFINEKPPGMSDPEVVANALEQITLADELGYDSIWLGEHHFAPYGTMPDTLLFGAAVAQVTKRIKIGTAVAVPTFTHPVRVAEQIAMLDVMSDGRFLVGLGRGYQQREFKGYGVPQEESKVRFQEATDIIDGLLSQESFSYDGQFWSCDELTIVPRPVQQPRPPIYIATSATPRDGGVAHQPRLPMPHRQPLFARFRLLRCRRECDPRDAEAAWEAGDARTFLGTSPQRAGGRYR